MMKEAATVVSLDGNAASPAAKIQQRLQTVFDAPPTKNRSPELVPLLAEYEKLKKNLRVLVAATKHYAETNQHVNAAREEVRLLLFVCRYIKVATLPHFTHLTQFYIFNLPPFLQLVSQLSLMSQNSPIFDDLGLGLDAPSSEALRRICESSESGNSVTQVIQKRNETEPEFTSLSALQQFASTQAVCNQREFNDHVVVWAMEWETTVTERVDAELKNVRKLQGDRDHYEKKVETLRRKLNDLEAKGKASPANQVEKLKRNEEKLKEAFLLHENNAGRLCAMIEAVTRDGWVELYSVRFVTNGMQFAFVL